MEELASLSTFSGKSQDRHLPLGFWASLAPEMLKSYSEIPVTQTSRD
jgi:hypothetical protein